jgi:glutathione peroxidase
MMSIRKSTLKLLYPLIMKLSKGGENGKIISNKKQTTPSQPFNVNQIILNNGKPLDSQMAQGKKILLVNTASNCGYTHQYADLEELYTKYKDKLLIVAFPANDFKEQEKGSDHEIEQFCKRNYGVSFPIALKAKVIKGENQQATYQWLTQAHQNGWNNTAPVWNFSKYLINETRVLTHYFGPAISPTSQQMLDAINN